MQPRCLGLSFDDHCLSHSVIVKLYVPVLTQACGLLRESVGGVGFEVVSCGLCICLVFVPAPPVDLNRYCQRSQGPRGTFTVAIGLPRRTSGAREFLAAFLSSFLKSERRRQPPTMPPAPRLRQSAPPVPPGLSYDDYKEELSASTLQRAVRARSPENKRAAARGKSLGPNASLPMAGGRDVASADARKGRMSVGVRVRPLSAKEEGRGSHACLEVTEGKHIFAYDPDEKMGGIDYLRLDKSKDKSYAFDCAYGPECTSEDVYEGTTKRVIRAVIDGFHGSCFAYGATGSGKTYTMLGDEAMPGVMPRAIRDLFAFAEQEDDWTWRFSMT